MRVLQLIARLIEIRRVPHLGRRINPVADLRALRELQQSHEYKPDIIHTHTFHGHLFDDPEFTAWKVPIVIRIGHWLARRTDALVTVGQRVEALQIPSRNPSTK